MLGPHMLTPGHRTAGVVYLLHCEVGHEAVRCGAVPVVLFWLEIDAVAGTDYFDRAALTLAEPDALGDEDRLPEWMGVPGGASAGGEVDAASREGFAAL